MTNKDKQLSLSIKTDENTKAVPLGIKSTVQGIEHFTNWNNVSNSIGETGGLRRDQTLYNNYTHLRLNIFFLCLILLIQVLCAKQIFQKH